MDDFLQQLRSNSQKQSNKNRRQYDSGRNRVYDRRNTQEPRRSIQRDIVEPERASAKSIEMMETINKLLEKFVKGHECLIAAEETKTRILEGIGETLKSLSENRPILYQTPEAILKKTTEKNRL